MLLAVDIGNTSITLGLMEGRRVVKTFQVATSGKPAAFERQCRIMHKALPENTFLEGIWICSVVPQALGQVEKIVRRTFSQKTCVIGRDVTVPLVNRYRNPRQVGQDRLVGAYAAMALYGCPVIVVDLGTAITFDVVSSRKEYLGGIIVPGIQLSADALFQRTALLPRVEIHKPRSLIGRDTEESILSGIFYGYGAMIGGMIGLLTKNLKSKPRVVITGGYADVMSRYIRTRVDAVDRDLVLTGMALLRENIPTRDRARLVRKKI